MSKVTTSLLNCCLIISLLLLAIVTSYAQNPNSAAWPLDSFAEASHTFEETLQIFHDKKGTTPFEAIIGKNQLFSANNTIENFQADQVYWAKLNLRGHSQKAANYLFGFSTIRWGAGWQYNDAWLVRADGSVIQQQSGFGLSKQEKSIPSAANLARFEIKQNELVTLYVRYKGAMKDKKRRPKRINLSLLKEAMHPTLFEGYPFKGHFSSKHLFERIPFDVNFFINQEIYVDASGTVNIDSIAKNWNQLDWKDVYSTKPVSNQVYWIKTRFYGSPYFNGEQTLYTPYRYGFDYVDAYWADGNDSYIHQRTGDKVSLEERPFNFWANFIKLDLSPIDTIDLFIRMEGLDPNYLTHQIALGHVDPSELFPNQVKEAWENGIFYGILSIQGIFFFLLFLIERERIHLYFVLFVLGLFFVFGFSSDNYFMFVPFPEGKNISATLMILGFFLCEVGFLKFTETYFNYAKASFISRWFIPVFIIIAAIGNLNAWWNYKMTVDYYYYAIREPAFLFALLLILISLVTGLVMAFIAPQQKNVSKKVFLLAFLPLLISSIFMNGHFLLVHFLLDPYILDLPYNGFDIYRIAIIAMLTLLAVSIGYRTNRLKADKAAAQRTKELNEAKAHLYTNITHEFRTPLTVILGMNHKMNRYFKDRNSFRHQEAANLVNRNGNQLLRLINQMLDLSKLESKSMPVEMEQGDIIFFIKYLFEAFESYAESKNIRMHFSREMESFIMDFDREKIQQILSNLLSNAIKFTPAGGLVNLHLGQQEDTQLLIKVQDSGIGISKKNIPFIFDRFYQADVPNDQQGMGTGIGLALTKELVHLLNGNIKVNSILQEGTTFTVFLPVTSQAAPIKNLELIKETSLTLEAFSTAQLPTALSLETNDQPNQTQAQLLIVEDNTDVILYLKACLEEQYQLSFAQDGQAGIDKAIEFIPDIIISDVMMPKKDGFELCATLKKDTRTSHIPIILLTAKATVADKIAGLEHGADAYLAKPFEPQELEVRLRKLLELRTQLQSRYINGNTPQADNNPAFQLEDEFLLKVKALILDNLDNVDFSVEILCKSIFLSRQQVHRKLIALTGHSTSHLIRSIRLQAAKKLLETTNKSITEIAFDVGFREVSYFSRVFSETFGHAPSFLRK